MKYIKKPVVIEAIQLTRDRERIAQCIEWVYDIDMSVSVIGRNSCIDVVINSNGLIIATLEGDMKANFGDYIIKEIKGEFWPCKPDVFLKSYEMVEVEIDE